MELAQNIVTIVVIVILVGALISAARNKANPEKLRRLPIKWGLIYGGVMVIVALVVFILALNGVIAA